MGKETLVPRRRTGMEGAAADEIEAAYRTTFRAFHDVAAAIVGDADAAFDAVQDAFASALRSRRRFRGDAPLEAWLWRIVLNSARDRRRAHERRPLLATAEPAVSPNGYEADELVRALLAQLPDRQREVIFLRYYADLDYAAIARVLEISEGTVGATLNAAHAALRRRMQEVRG